MVRACVMARTIQTGPGQCKGVRQVVKPGRPNSIRMQLGALDDATSLIEPL
jgi:hypothetical protein